MAAPVPTGARGVARCGRCWYATRWGLAVTEPPWLDRRAVTRLTASSPRLLVPLTGRRLADGESIKPCNCILAAGVRDGALTTPAGADPQRFRPIARYTPDAGQWGKVTWTNLRDGRRYQLGGKLATLCDVLTAYRSHPERKSAGPDGAPCGRGTVGLLGRRAVRAGAEARALRRAAAAGDAGRAPLVRPPLPAGRAAAGRTARDGPDGMTAGRCSRRRGCPERGRGAATGARRAMWRQLGQRMGGGRPWRTARERVGAEGGGPGVGDGTGAGAVCGGAGGACGVPGGAAGVSRERTFLGVPLSYPGIHCRPQRRLHIL
jgi:hypothetical protein